MPASRMVVEPEPGDRAAAPGHLRILQQFVNTVDREEGSDLLARPADLGFWVSTWLPDLGEVEWADDDVLRAHRLREGFRQLADGLDPGEDFDSVLREGGLGVERVGLAFRTAGTTGAGRLAGSLVDIARAAMDDGTWSRLKVCERDVCRWLFYDHSKNNSSKWCASSVCGAREKARRAYQRRTHPER